MYVSQYLKIATFAPFCDAAPHIYIIVILDPILKCMIHYNLCNDKGKYWTILRAGGSGNHTM